MDAAEIRTQSTWWFAVKAFAWFGGFFGVGTYVLYQLTGVPDGPSSAAARGLLFGLTMTLASTAGQLLPARRRGRSGVLGTQQVGWISLNLGGGDLAGACRQALISIGACVIEPTTDPRVIVASMPMSWKSWGESLQICLAESPDGETRVQVASQPRMPFTLGDWGKNLSNVEVTLREVARLAGQD